MEYDRSKFSGMVRNEAGEETRIPRKQLDPASMLKDDFEQIKIKFLDREKELRKNSKNDNEFKAGLTELQGEYDKYKAQFEQQAKQLNTVNTLTQQGAITPEAANEAMFRMVVPPETAAAMFPRQATQRQPSRPLTPDQLENFDESIGQHVQSAPSKDRPGWDWPQELISDWTDQKRFAPKKSQSALTAAYMKWRDRIQYDVYEPHHQRQLDTEWDAVMASDDRFEWDASKPEVRILRTKGPIGSAIINKKFQTPTRMSGNGPIQVGIAKQLPSNQQTRKPADPLGIR